MQRRIYLILVLALFSVSSTSLVIRHVAFVPALTLAFWRMLTASGILWAFSARIRQRAIQTENRKKIIFAGFFLGLHFALFFIGVRNTSVASATLLANTGPVFTALLSWFSGMSISRSVFWGLAISIIGIVVVQWSEFSLEKNNVLGNLFSLLSGFCIAMTYMFASHIRKNTDNTLYGRSVFLVAAITIGIIAVFSGVSIFDFKKEDVIWLLFLGIVPSIMGHNMLNYSIKYLSPTAVASIPLGEPVLASLFGYLLFLEKIPESAIYGAPIVFIGIVIIIKNSALN